MCTCRANGRIESLNGLPEPDAATEWTILANISQLSCFLIESFALFTLRRWKTQHQYQPPKAQKGPESHKSEKSARLRHSPGRDENRWGKVIAQAIWKAEI